MTEKPTPKAGQEWTAKTGHHRVAVVETNDLMERVFLRHFAAGYPTGILTSNTYQELWGSFTLAKEAPDAT